MIMKRATKIFVNALALVVFVLSVIAVDTLCQKSGFGYEEDSYLCE